jgi:hypothetical protein
MVRDTHAVGTETVSRRTALQRFGKTGLAASFGAGILELVGAPAKAQSRTGLAASPASGVPVITTGGGLSPESCKCTGHLAEGHCNGPCPSGFYCYEVDSCGSATTKYACINCEGTPTCAYDCS